MPPPPYEQYLDVDAMLRLEFGLKGFILQDALFDLYRFDHPGSHEPVTPSTARAHFERLRRSFAAQTEDDYLLRDFVASERDRLKRAVALNGKLTLMLPIANDCSTFSLLLSDLGLAIWQPPEQ